MTAPNSVAVSSHRFGSAARVLLAAIVVASGCHAPPPPQPLSNRYRPAGHAHPPRRAHTQSVLTPSVLVPAAVMVLGGGALAGGLLAIAVDEDHARPGTDYYYDSAPGGAIACTVGALAIAIGGYLFFKALPPSPSVAQE